MSAKPNIAIKSERIIEAQIRLDAQIADLQHKARVLLAEIAALELKVATLKSFQFTE